MNEIYITIYILRPCVIGSLTAVKYDGVVLEPADVGQETLSAAVHLPAYIFLQCTEVDGVGDEVFIQGQRYFVHRVEEGLTL